RRAAPRILDEVHRPAPHPLPRRDGGRGTAGWGAVGPDWIALARTGCAGDHGDRSPADDAARRKEPDVRDGVATGPRWSRHGPVPGAEYERPHERRARIGARDGVGHIRH